MLNRLKNCHRAWYMLVACCLLEAGTMGILWNCTGLFYAPICQELGFQVGDLSLFVTLRSLAGAFTVGFLVRLMRRVPLKPFFLVILAICCGAFSVTALYHHLFQWYISGFIMGIAGSSFFIACTGIFINNWFYKKSGLAMGIAMAAAGVGGAIFNPIISNLIALLGWRISAVLTGLIAFALTMPIAFIIAVKPADVGLTAYGSEETEGESDAKTKKKSAGSRVLSRILPYPKITFAACLGLLAPAYFLSQYNGHLATFVQLAGYSVQIAGTITAIAMIGNVLSKLLFGIIADRMGIWTAIAAGLASSALAFALMISTNFTTMCIGALLYGAAYTMATLPPALVTKHVYGLAHYEKYYTIIVTINQISAAVAFTVIGYMRDYFGSYVPTFYLGMILCGICVVSMVILVIAIRGAKAKEAL